jgi:hypothetical protein
LGLGFFLLLENLLRETFELCKNAPEGLMKKVFSVGIAALFLATGAAHASMHRSWHLCGEYLITDAWDARYRRSLGDSARPQQIFHGEKQLPENTKAACQITCHITRRRLVLSWTKMPQRVGRRRHKSNEVARPPATKT